MHYLNLSIICENGLLVAYHDYANLIKHVRCLMYVLLTNYSGMNNQYVRLT
jgi:hypothetical protein